MRPLVLIVTLVAAPWLVGCTQTWGLAEPAPPASDPSDPVVPADPELRRLDALAEAIAQAIEEVEAEIDRAQADWPGEPVEAVRKELEAQQGLLERRLVLSLAAANVQAARQRRLDALEQGGDESLPAREPVPDTVDEAVSQAAEQLRTVRDQRDTDARTAKPGRSGPSDEDEPAPLEDKRADGERKKRKRKSERRRQERAGGDGARIEGAAVVPQPATKVDVAAALTPHFATLAGCVGSGAKGKRVMVRGRLDGQGRFREVRVLSGVSTPAVRACLVERLEAVTVDMPEGSSGMVVTIPLQF
jgi:hypothetical protein